MNLKYHTKLFILLICMSAVLISASCKNDPPSESGSSSFVSAVTPSSGITPSPTPTATPTPSPTPSPTPEPTPTPTPTPLPFNPHAVDETDPDKFGMRTDIMVDGTIVSEYSREDKISFGPGSSYTEVKGVITFRGNNYRDTSGVYGSLNIVNKGFADEALWRQRTTSIPSMAGSGYWSGCGWTGQPLITEWSKEVRSHMNLYDWAKEQKTLVEVIYATEDGNIYFYELETGKATRDPMSLPYTFKGSGSLDPRGYPIMYVGGGDRNASYSSPRFYIINLLTNTVMYEFGNDDPFARRGWYAFDGGTLVDVETDTFICPGENGIIYFMHLGTQYDEAAGTLSISPSNIVKWRYTGSRSVVNSKYWLGFESSVIAYEGYLFIPDNGGHMMCLDINTLKLVWVQDVLDDTNCTGVLEIEDGKPYIYMSTSFHAGWRASVDSTAPIPVWKINAETGEIVWRTDYTCYTTDGNSGGAQGSLAAGKGSLKDIVYIPMGRTPGRWEGILVALNKRTGEKVWELKFEDYMWSSPVLVYDEKTGAGYVIQGDSHGRLCFIDGLTGEVLDVFQTDGNIEATPAVYNNILVVGTRGCSIYALRIE